MRDRDQILLEKAFEKVWENAYGEEYFHRSKAHKRMNSKSSEVYNSLKDLEGDYFYEIQGIGHHDDHPLEYTFEVKGVGQFRIWAEEGKYEWTPFLDDSRKVKGNVPSGFDKKFILNDSDVDSFVLELKNWVKD